MTEIKPLWEILVPYKMGRKNVQVPYHQEWDAKVMAIAGGMTLMKVAKGCATVLKNLQKSVNF